MDKTYSPQAIEQELYQHWETKGYFKPSGQGDAYCIMIPPPNVTGSLHMGLASKHTIMNTLIRNSRMTALNRLGKEGTNKAGFQNKMSVKRNLPAPEKTR